MPHAVLNIYTRYTFKSTPRCASYIRSRFSPRGIHITFIPNTIEPTQHTIIIVGRATSTGCSPLPVNSVLISVVVVVYMLRGRHILPRARPWSSKTAPRESQFSANQCGVTKHFF